MIDYMGAETAMPCKHPKFAAKEGRKATWVGLTVGQIALSAATFCCACTKKSARLTILPANPAAPMFALLDQGQWRAFPGETRPGAGEY
jgi:hypothetical protein